VQILLHRPCELVNGRLQRSQALIQQPPRVVAYDDDRQGNHKPDFISKTGSQRLRNRVFRNKPGSMSGEDENSVSGKYRINARLFDAAFHAACAILAKGNDL
jgi:hypothetical protein